MSDQNNETPPEESRYTKPFSLSELGKGLSQAAGRGVKTPIFSFKKGLFGVAATRTGRQMADAATSVADAARAATSSYKRAAKSLDGTEEPTIPSAREPLLDDDIVSGYRRNALIGWRVYAVMFVASAALALCSQVWTNSTSTNRLVWSVIMMAGSGYKAMRISHDYWIMFLRAPISGREFFSEIEFLWCPIPSETERKLYTYVAGPLALAMLAATPIVGYF